MNSEHMPHFEFSQLPEHLTLLSGELIDRFIDEHCSNFAVDINDEFSYYNIPFPNDARKSIDFLIVHKRLDFDKLDTKSHSVNVYRLYRNTMMCEGRPAVAMILNYGHYMMDYFQAFINIGHSEFAHELIQQYKLATASKIDSDDAKLKLSKNIDFLKKFAKDHNQFKDINNYDYSTCQLKQYCDLDFSVYYIDEKTLNVCCHASAIIYSCVFDDFGGYKIYAQHKDYGMKCEELNNPSYDRYDNEDDCYDRLLSKYIYQDEFVIFEKVGDEFFTYDLMVGSLIDITGFIVDEESPS